MASFEPHTLAQPYATDPSVSVIVVSFNTQGQLRRCLSSVEPIHEIIVVDNCSSDGSAEMVRSEFPHVRLIVNESNLGFGAANNIGLSVATNSLVLFLNSDCYPAPGTIARLAMAMAQTDVCAVGGRLLNSDGTLQQSAAHMLNLWHVLSEQTGLERVLPVYWSTPSLDISESVPVGQVMGACLMIRNSGIKFDEEFFLYCEDTDLIRRIVAEERRSGRPGTILYVSEAEFTHELGASSQGDSRWLAVARYNRGKEIYFRKHSGVVAASTCLCLNRLGALARLVAWSAASAITLLVWTQARARAVLWFRVLTAPLSGPRRPKSTDP